MADADALADVRELWPKVTEVTASAILKLKQGLVLGETFLGYRFLRGFIAAGCQALLKAEGGDINLVSLTRETLRTTERILGPLKSSTSAILTDNEGALLATIATKVNEIKTAEQKFNTTLEQLCDDAADDETLVDI